MCDQQSTQQNPYHNMSVNKQVVEYIKNTIATNPKTQSLELELMLISDIGHYMKLLSQLPNLKYLSLAGNRLKQLPIDMSSLENLQQLDLSNNIISDIDLLIQSLKSLPNLKVLKLQVKKDRQSQIIQSLRKLTLLNDLHIIRQPAKKPMALKYMNEVNLKQFKKQMNRQYKKIREFEQSYLNEKSTESSQQKFMGQMDNIIKQSMKKIVEKEGELTQSLQIAYFNKTKYQIYDYIKNRCINIGMDIYGDLGKMIRDVWDTQQAIFEAVIKECLKLVKIQYEMMEIKKDKEENNKMDIQHKIFVKNQHLQKQVKRIKKQKDQLIIQINQLQSENKRYLESLVRFAKGDKTAMNLNIPNQSHFSKQSSPNITQSVHPQSIKPAQRSGLRSANITRQIIPMGNFSNGKNLSLKQLKETIQQIYESKQKFDQKNFDERLPRQTMHQYLFTYLNQKYGLKTLTIENASKIVAGIQAYSTEDNDVAVFGKILRNQLDEQFRIVQSNLKDIIFGTLKRLIQSTNPLKSLSEIDTLCKQKINGEINLDEIQKIVGHYYEKSDADVILSKIQVASKLNKPKEEPTHRRHMRDEQYIQKQKKKIKFSIFLKIVLDFQLKMHQIYLRPLVNAFKTRDRNFDGIVNQQQFIEVVEQLCEQAKQLIPEFLMMLDPYDNKKISFSQIARLFTNYPLNNPILNRFVQKQDYVQDIE